MLLKKLLNITDPAYMNALSRAGTIGLHMVSGVAVGAIFGFFLDKWLGTRPWLSFFFLFVGIVAGFKNVYVDTKRLIASQNDPRIDPPKPDAEPKVMPKSTDTEAQEAPDDVKNQSETAASETSGEQTKSNEQTPPQN